MQGTHVSLGKRTFFEQEHPVQKSEIADLAVSRLPDERFEEDGRLAKTENNN